MSSPATAHPALSRSRVDAAAKKGKITTRSGTLVWATRPGRVNIRSGTIRR